MAVYFDPYYRGTANVGFFNNLGNQAAGIISNLIGQQLTGMFDRAAKAKQVDAARAVMNGVPDISGMNPLQAKQAYMSNPDFWKLSPEMQASLMGNVKTAEQYAGYDTLRKGIEPLYGAPAADMTIGAQQAGYAPANVGQLIERGMPEYKEQLIDQGNQLQYFQRNPFQPGIVSGTTQTFKKGATPDAVLKDQQTKAELAQQKLLEEQRLANTLKIANLENGTRLKIAGMDYNKPQWFQGADGSWQSYDIYGNAMGKPIVGTLINNKSATGNGGDSYLLKNQLEALKMIQTSLETAKKEEIDEAKRANIDKQLAQVHNTIVSIAKLGGPQPTTGGGGGPSVKGMPASQIAVAAKDQGKTPEQVMADLKAKGIPIIQGQ